MKYLIFSIFLYGMMPIVGLLSIDKITFLFYGLIFNIVFFIFFIDINFLKKNIKHTIYSAILRGTSSIAYFYAYDLGVGPIVVTLVFLQPLLYSLLCSLDQKCWKNIDLVLFASIGGYLLTSKFPNFSFDFKLIVALASPVLSAVALFHFKKYIHTNSVKETINVVLVRSLFIGITLPVLFNIDFNISSLNILYSGIYGVLLLGVAMIGFFHASKLINPKTFSLITNIEFILAFVVMLLVFNIYPNYIQWIGGFIVFFSLFILRYRHLKKR